MRVIDSDVFIDYFRGYPPAIRFLGKLKGRADVLYTAVTESEIISGAENTDDRRREIVLGFLRQWTKVSFGNPVAAFAGDLRREHGLSIPDAIIAATAQAHDAELVTRNVNDFKRVPELRVRVPY
jgi:hypothetical protein